MKKKPFSSASLDSFQQAAQSLKLYRRAELLVPDSNDPLIDQLYVDPLPNEHIFKTLLKAHTTYLVGRKGTGKSTLFQRLQSEVRNKKGQTSAYIDIKTVFESSQIDPLLSSRLKNHAAALPPESLEKLLLFREFIHSVIVEIKTEVQKRIESSLWEKIKDKVTTNSKDLFEGLDELLTDIKEDKFQSVLGLYVENRKSTAGISNKESENISVEASLSEKPAIGAKLGTSNELMNSNNSEIEYSDVLLRTFNIREVIAQLKGILEKAGIRNLYILIDDFSELPEEAMKIVVDVLIMPLNNWSDEFVKFKIAAYPGRIYYGQIDKMKVDEIYLDLYKLYGGGDVGRMEDSATDFTKRLIENRINHYCKLNLEDYCSEGQSNIWPTLFHASMANPRILGYLLSYLHESHLIREKKITVSAILEASQRYYEEKVESYFTIGKFLHESFKERSSIFSLKELIESIVSRARELRGHDSQVMKKIQGTPPTSHFYVPVDIEPLFSTLELNFFLTKFYEQTDRNGKKVTIFSLNFGLCSKYSIKFGRPTGEREFRLYYVERVFDYSSIVKEYLNKNQEIICDNCGFKYSLENLAALQFYDLQCKKCGTGKVEILNLSKKYESELKRVSDGLLLPGTELGILQTLFNEDSNLRPRFIAAELDCSYQLIGKRARNLSEMNLITKSIQTQAVSYKISEKAIQDYFSENDRESLNLDEKDANSAD
jgi:energy-coupling factor transporter ATP-binding protein EcfA2